MYITLGAYLDKLKGDEGQKPKDERREVPTIKDLAQSVEVHYVTLTNIANDKVNLLNLETMQKVLDDLRRRGFKPDVTDVIQYRPPEG